MQTPPDNLLGIINNLEKEEYDYITNSIYKVLESKAKIKDNRHLYY